MLQCGSHCEPFCEHIHFHLSRAFIRKQELLGGPTFCNSWLPCGAFTVLKRGESQHTVPLSLPFCHNERWQRASARLAAEEDSRLPGTMAEALLRVGIQHAVLLCRAQAPLGEQASRPQRHAAARSVGWGLLLVSGACFLNAGHAYESFSQFAFSLSWKLCRFMQHTVCSRAHAVFRVLLCGVSFDARRSMLFAR